MGDESEIKVIKFNAFTSTYGTVNLTFKCMEGNLTTSQKRVFAMIKAGVPLEAVVQRARFDRVGLGITKCGDKNYFGYFEVQESPAVARDKFQRMLLAGVPPQAVRLAAEYQDVELPPFSINEALSLFFAPNMISCPPPSSSPPFSSPNKD